MRFKFYKQLDAVDCGPTCLRMVAYHYGKSFSLKFLRSKSYITREGTSFLTIRGAAEDLGFKTFAAELSYDHLFKSPLPCILFWNENHFVVLYKIENRKNILTGKSKPVFHIADPSAGIIKVDKATFLKCWVTKKEKRGFALFLAPTESFYDNDERIDQKEKFNGTAFLLKYFFQYKAYFLYVLLAVVAGSILSLTLPFITQSIVDVGIANRDINFITLMLVCQLTLFVGSTITNVIQSYLLLHVSSRINISLVSDFLSKLMKLPINFFESKMIGDIVQRVQDHNRIDKFLTSSFLDVFLSIINLVVFSVVLAIYDANILYIFAVGSVLAVLWTFIFNERKRSIDYRNFQQLSHNTEKLYEIINGMQEIKLNGFENYKKWEWENVQVKLFKIKTQNLTLQQYQELGSSFLSQLKNIFITYVAAYGVVQGDLTLGMMLSIAYITGQLNVPVERIKTFFISLQGVRFSLERMSEVHQKDEEESSEDIILPETSFLKNDDTAINLINNKSGLHSTYGTEGLLSGKEMPMGLSLENVSFQYEGPKSPLALDKVNLQIPLNKITAVVGMSGSGKTTLMKLLLKFHEPVAGNIFLNGVDLSRLSAAWWREQCGTVMQEGFIFSDTISRNIAMVAEEDVDEEKLLNAARVANIEKFVQELPLGFETKIGGAGSGLSTGQKQRILIARAVYKNPSFLFFDEATSSLDANNEKVIMQNLDEFFKNKTVLIIAHRLSTVKNADQLIVLEKGEVVEIGNHNELIRDKGRYFHLVKNQLELGN